MNDLMLKAELNSLKKINGKIYTPLKYFRGLETKNQLRTRFLRIKQGIKSDSNDATSYKPFKTDKKSLVKESKYTKSFYDKYPLAKSLKDKSETTGIPYSIIKKVYDKGLAAWRTGHRPGASQQAWGYARVHSFIMLGCTSFTADKYLVKKALKKMKQNDVITWKSTKIMCPKYKNDKKSLFEVE